jgi:hypothetical protein
MPAVPLHRSEPLTARTACPPLSGSGGGGDGDDFGALVANDDDPMPATPPHRSKPSTARAACPPLSGGGNGEDFGAWLRMSLAVWTLLQRLLLKTTSHTNMGVHATRPVLAPPTPDAPSHTNEGRECNKAHPWPPPPMPPQAQTPGECNMAHLWPPLCTNPVGAKMCCGNGASNP